MMKNCTTTTTAATAATTVITVITTTELTSSLGYIRPTPRQRTGSLLH